MSLVLIKAAVAHLHFSVVYTLNTVDLSLPYPLRSYRIRGGAPPACTVLQAACASIASRDSFLSVTIGKGNRCVKLVEASQDDSNPARELLREAGRIDDGATGVATVLSIGSGKESHRGISTRDERELAESLKRALNSCERVHEGLASHLDESGIYFRFNPDGVETESSAVYSRVSSYLQPAPVSNSLDKAIKSIDNRIPRTTLRNISELSSPLFPATAHSCQTPLSRQSSLSSHVLRSLETSSDATTFSISCVKLTLMTVLLTIMLLLSLY